MSNKNELLEKTVNSEAPNKTKKDNIKNAQVADENINSTKITDKEKKSKDNNKMVNKETKNKHNTNSKIAVNDKQNNDNNNLAINEKQKNDNSKLATNEKQNNDNSKLATNEKQKNNKVKKEMQMENSDQTKEKVKNEFIKNDIEEKFTYVPVQKKPTDVLSIFVLLVVMFFTVVLLVFTGFTIYNVFNPNIVSGISIKGIDVSGLSPSDAKYQLDNYLSDKLPEEIKVTHGDFETTISLAQMGIHFDTKTATNSAFSIARQGNAFENNLTVLKSMFDKVNIEPGIVFDKDLLTKNLEDISTQLPDTVVQSSYYIEGNDLIITSGKEGNVVDVDSTIQSIANSLSNFSALNTPIELSVKTKQPEKIDVEKIYNEVKKDPVDAYYTKDPFAVHPSENGVDFNISLDDAKNMISSEVKEEYIVPLKFITPNVTTNMIGTEAFPDLLSTFSTRYAASNRNRTTNLILAANKINGTVLMPGETFSYNKVVGARTIAAGYKEAPIYVEGRVEDGLRWRYLSSYFYFV